MTKITLSEEIRSRLQSLHLKIRGVATHLGVPEASVRTWIFRNRFPTKLGLELCRYLNLPSTKSELEAQYEIAGWTREHEIRSTMQNVATLREAFRITDRRRGRQTDDLSGFWREIGELIDHMNQGDLAVVATATVTPEEMDVSPDSRPLRERIALAVKRGARFLYLRPTREILDPYRLEWHFKEFPDADRVAVEFRNLVRGLEHDLGGGAKFKAQVAAQVAQILVRDSPFWVPGFVIGMIQTQDSQRNLDRRMWCRLPGGHSGILYRERNSVFDERFAEFVYRSLKGAVAELPMSPRGHAGKSDSAVLRKTLDEIGKILDALYPWEQPY